MMQFTLEILSMAMSSIIIIVGLIYYHFFSPNDEKTKANKAYVSILTFFLGSNIIDMIAYIIMVDNYESAISFKMIGSIFYFLGLLFYILWTDYAQNDTIKPYIGIPTAIISGIAITLSLFADNYETEIFYNGAEIIGYSIGKAGVLDVMNIALGIITMAWLFLYFVITFIKSPDYLKKTGMHLIIWIGVIYLSHITLFILADILANTIFALYFYSITNLLEILIFLVYLIYIIKYPSLTFMFQFKVDRLMIIQNTTGICIYEKKYSEAKLDELLFGGLISGLQHMSVEVLQKGRIREINLEEGILLFEKREKFSAALLSSKSSKALRDDFFNFTDAFDTEFKEDLNKFQGDITVFRKTKKLVDKYLKAVPEFTKTNTK